MKHTGILALGALLAMGAPLSAEEDRVLAFPENYRADFTLYFTGDRLMNDDQTIRLFANDIAREGLREDDELPDGSVLVAELYAALKDDEGEIAESGLGRRLPGAMKAIAVMERRDGWDDQYGDDLKVGDWEFELFSPAGENLGQDTTGCRVCHHPLEDTEFLFSREHIAAFIE